MHPKYAHCQDAQDVLNILRNLTEDDDWVATDAPVFAKQQVNIGTRDVYSWDDSGAVIACDYPDNRGYRFVTWEEIRNARKNRRAF